MTYRELINKYSEIIKNDNELELEGIEFIIQEMTHFSRSELILNLDKQVINIVDICNALDNYCIDKIPSQYVIGYCYFYGVKIHVNPNVLIPRFDTEIAVEEVIEYLEEKQGEVKLLDVGTGSGAIAIAIANSIGNSIANKNINIKIDAVDISDEALAVARFNCKQNGVDINLYNSDLFSNVNGSFDCIVSNPPYIDEFDINEGLMNIVKYNEPRLALFSKDKGLYHYKRIIKEGSKYLKDDGVLFLEMPDNKCDKIIEFAKDYYNEILIYRDYNNLRRVLKIGGKK